MQQCDFCYKVRDEKWKEEVADPDGYDDQWRAHLDTQADELWLACPDCQKTNY